MALYLITGIAGFIGSNLAHELVRRGERVRGVDDFSTGSLENLADLKGKIEVMQLDLLDTKALSAASRNVDFVLHHAAVRSTSFEHNHLLASNTVNVMGTLNLLSCASRCNVKRVIFASSGAVYGPNYKQPVHEFVAPQAVSAYAAQKLAGEHYMSAFALSSQLETVSLRYFNVFGPSEDPTCPRAGIVAQMIGAMFLGKDCTISGNGQQRLGFTLVEDVISANLLACAAPSGNVNGKVFNIASGNSSQLEAFRVLSSFLEYQRKPLYRRRSREMLETAQANISLAAKSLEYVPSVSLEDGFRRAADWCKRGSSLEHP